MATSESKGRFFTNESIRIDSHKESNRIDLNRELQCSNVYSPARWVTTDVGSGCVAWNDSIYLLTRAPYELRWHCCVNGVIESLWSTCMLAMIGRLTHVDWLIDWVVVLRPARHKIVHFGDVSQSQSLGLVWKKTKSNTTKAHIAPIKRNVLQHKINTSRWFIITGTLSFYCTACE